MSDEDRNLPKTSGAHYPTTTSRLSLKFPSQRFAQWQNTQLHKAEARLLEAITQYYDAGARLGKAELALKRQLAENQAYDHDREIRINAMTQEMEEIEIAQKLDQARYEFKKSKRDNKHALKKPRYNNRKAGHSPKPTFADRAEHILKHGNRGPAQTEAEDMIEALLQQAGVKSESDLPLELQENIVELRLEALREDQSKG